MFSYPVAFAPVLWCASVLFLLLLGWMLFSQVIRMPASSTASFRPFASLKATRRAATCFLGLYSPFPHAGVQPYPTCVISVCTYSLSFISPILTLTRQTLNVLVFSIFLQYFTVVCWCWTYSSCVMYVKCMMKYDIKNVKEYVTHIHCKHTGYVVYNSPPAVCLYCMIYDGIFTIYSTHYCEKCIKYT